MGEICRNGVVAYVAHMQDRGLKTTSVKNHLHTVYAFIQYPRVLNFERSSFLTMPILAPTMYI